MRKKIKRIVLIAVGFFILLQCWQPARNQDNGQAPTVHFTQVYNVPPEVQNILQTSCYDCHSNNTKYPWYSWVQPARMLMENDIKKGKSNLNFSEWGNYSTRKQANKLSRITKQIKQGAMPLSSYTLIHQNARLSESQKQEVITWINSISTDE